MWLILDYVRNLSRSHGVSLAADPYQPLMLRFKGLQNRRQ